MGRKSSIDKLPADVRSHIEKRLRENRLTLDELFADVREAFPDLVETPSRSALGRYRMGFEEIMQTQRAMSTAASALVAELGEDFDDKSGALLTQAVTTLATKATFRQLNQDELDIGDVLDLARAAKAAQESRSLNLRERQAVAKMAREKLLEEQKAKLEAMGSKVTMEARGPHAVTQWTAIYDGDSHIQFDNCRNQISWQGNDDAETGQLERTQYDGETASFITDPGTGVARYDNLYNEDESLERVDKPTPLGTTGGLANPNQVNDLIDDPRLGHT